MLGLQEQRFVEQQQVSLEWISQGLSISGRKRSKISLSSNPATTKQEVSCVPNTPNTIGALVRRRDSEIQVIWMSVSGNSNRNEIWQRVNIQQNSKQTVIRCLEARPRDPAFTSGHSQQ